MFLLTAVGEELEAPVASSLEAQAASSIVTKMTPSSRVQTTGIGAFDSVTPTILTSLTRYGTSYRGEATVSNRRTSSDVPACVVQEAQGSEARQREERRGGEKGNGGPCAGVRT